MGLKKVMLKIAAVPMAALFLASCGMVEKTQEAIDNTVLATVNGENITQKDLEEEAKSYIDSMIIQYGQEALETDEGKEVLAQLKVDVLNALVEMRILDLKAAEAGITRDSEDVIAKTEERVKAVKDIYGEDEEEFQEALTAMGFTEETYFEYVKDEIVRSTFYDMLMEDVKATDEELQEYYEKNKAGFVERAGANIFHIYLGTDEDRARERGEEALRKMREEGATFAEMAEEYSDDLSAGRGGELGYYPYVNYDLYEDFMDHVKELEEGEISDIVKSTAGYHIITVTDVQPEDVQLTFEEVEDRIRASVENTKKQEKYAASMAEWREEFNVSVHENRIH